MRRGTVFAMSSLLLCAAAAGLTSSGTLLALSQHDAPRRARRTLTFEERVSYQRAIEDVYWRHRLWPKENSYAQRIHGELKQCAETELQTRASLEQMKQLSGKYTEIELIRQESAHGKNTPARRSMKLNNHEWDDTVQKLVGMFSDQPVA